MNALAFDASGTIISACLYADEQLYTYELRTKHGSSEQLLHWASSLMENAKKSPKELDFVCCPSGPGSFTGLRLAIASAKGLSIALDIPLYTTSTFIALARPWKAWDTPVWILLEAGKQRWFAACFISNVMQGEPLDIDAPTLGHLLAEYPQNLISGPGAGSANMALQAIEDKSSYILDPLFMRSCAKEILEISIETFNTGTSGETADKGLDYLRRSSAEYKGATNS